MKDWLFFSEVVDEGSAAPNVEGLHREYLRNVVVDSLIILSEPKIATDE